jgi:hypothetical protein
MGELLELYLNKSDMFVFYFNNNGLLCDWVFLQECRVGATVVFFGNTMFTNLLKEILVIPFI